MLTISAFAKLSGLSPKSLRYYHDRGLLIPAHVDEHTGYRGYILSQLDDALTIRLLRHGGMPSETIREVLTNPDQADELIEEHRETLRQRRRREDRALARASGARSGHADAVRRRFSPPQPYAARTLRVGPVEQLVIEDVNLQVDHAIERLHALLAEAGIEAAGPPSTGFGHAGDLLELAIQIPIDAAPDQPDQPDPMLAGEGVRFETRPERHEAAITVPLPEQDGDESIQLALSALLAYTEHGRPDVHTLRQTILTESGQVEYAVALLPADAAEVER